MGVVRWNRRFYMASKMGRCWNVSKGSHLNLEKNLGYFVFGQCRVVACAKMRQATMEEPSQCLITPINLLPDHRSRSMASIARERKCLKHTRSSSTDLRTYTDNLPQGYLHSMFLPPKNFNSVGGVHARPWKPCKSLGVSFGTGHVDQSSLASIPPVAVFSVRSNYKYQKRCSTRSLPILL